LGGRGFTEQDTATSQPVAIVNQIGIDLPDYSSSYEMVGVSADFKMNNPRDAVRPVYPRLFRA
jgi:hypothetical protein